MSRCHPAHACAVWSAMPEGLCAQLLDILVTLLTHLLWKKHRGQADEITLHIGLQRRRWWVSLWVILLFVYSFFLFNPYLGFRCWATSGHWNSFSALWQRFYKFLELYQSDEHCSSRRYSPISVQLGWELVNMKVIANDLHHLHPQQWALVLCGWGRRYSGRFYIHQERNICLLICSDPSL